MCAVVSMKLPVDMGPISKQFEQLLSNHGKIDKLLHTLEKHNKVDVQCMDENIRLKTFVVRECHHLGILSVNEAVADIRTHLSLGDDDIGMFFQKKHVQNAENPTGQKTKKQHKKFILHKKKDFP